MNKRAATKPRRISNTGVTVKAGRTTSYSKPSKPGRTPESRALAKRRIIPPATRPGFRVPSLTKKSVMFVLDAPLGHDVTIAGTFSDWEPLPMTKGRDGQWRTTLQLSHGTYQYRFYVDSQWQEDQNNPRKTMDATGACNSVCDVL